jgi:hypothetical protein
LRGMWDGGQDESSDPSKSLQVLDFVSVVFRDSHDQPRFCRSADDEDQSITGFPEAVETFSE